MDTQLIPQVFFAHGFQVFFQCDYNYKDGFMSGLIDKFMSLPIEVRQIIYGYVLWGSGPDMKTSRTHSGITLVHRLLNNNCSLFLDTTGVFLEDNNYTKQLTWVELPNKSFKLRTGLTAALEKRCYIHAIHLITALQNLWFWDGKKMRKDITVVKDFVSWFYNNTVIELRNDGQLVKKGETPYTPYSLSQMITPAQYSMLTHLSIDFSPLGEFGINTPQRAHMFRRVCAFVINNLTLRTITFWLSLFNMDLDMTFENPGKQRWIRDFRLITVTDRFEMKLALRWETFIGPLQKGESRVQMVNVAEVKLMSGKLKQMLMPVSLLGGLDEMYAGLKRLFLED